MTARIRYGLIGAGMMGREHIENVKLIPEAEVVAIADTEPASREAALALLGPGASSTNDYGVLAQSREVNALIVATPNHTHAEILDYVLATRPDIPVLVEKPAVIAMAGARRLADAAEAHRAPLWVAMEYRYMPAVARLIERTRSGQLGRLRMLSIREHRFPFLPKVGDWNRFARNTGGTLVEKCCHFFDLMRLILADEPVRVFGSGGQDVNHLDEDYGGERPDIVDNAYVIVDFRGGARAMLELCMFAEGAEHQEEIAVIGDHAKVEARVPGPQRFWPGALEHPETAPQPRVIYSPRQPKGPRELPVEIDRRILHAGDHQGSTYHQHVRFARAIREGGPVEVTMMDGIRAVAIGLAAERSIKERVPVALEGWPFG